MTKTQPKVRHVIFPSVTLLSQRGELLFFNFVFYLIKFDY